MSLIRNVTKLVASACSRALPIIQQNGVKFCNYIKIKTGQPLTHVKQNLTQHQLIKTKAPQLYKNVLEWLSIKRAKVVLELHKMSQQVRRVESIHVGKYKVYSRHLFRMLKFIGLVSYTVMWLASVAIIQWMWGKIFSFRSQKPLGQRIKAFLPMILKLFGFILGVLVIIMRTLFGLSMWPLRSLLGLRVFFRR
jgi:hypothetical protein